MENLARYVSSSAERVRQARRIADSLRYDETLHRLAMQTVFVLEDSHEALLQTYKMLQAR